MSLSNLVRMLVKRDPKGEVIINPKTTKPIPTWVSPVALHFWKAEPPMTREVNLWREVAARLTLDALGFTSVANKSKQERVKAMAEAQAMFRYEPGDIGLIFMAGGVAFDPVYEAVLKIIDNKDLFSNDSEENLSEGA